MSAKVVNHVLETSKLTGSARLLMVVLADMSNNDGECWPGKSSLARRVNVSTRQIVRLVQECERKGELRVISEPGVQNRYLIIGIAQDIRVRRARKTREKLERIQRVDVRGDTGVTGDTDVQKGVTPVSPKLSTEPSTVKERAAKTATDEKPKRGKRQSAYTPPKSYAETSGLSHEELQAQSDALIGLDPAAHPTTKEALRRAIITAREYDPLRLTPAIDGLIKTAAKQLHDIDFSADDIPVLHRYIVSKEFSHFSEMAYAKYAPEWLALQQKHKPAPVIPFEPEPEITESERAERLAIIRSRHKIMAAAR